MKKRVVLYIHGKGGNAREAEHFRPIFPNCDIFGLDYRGNTPWDAGKEIAEKVSDFASRYDEITLIANSLGAFFSMNSGMDRFIQKAYFISPIVDMVRIIEDIMKWANVTEAELSERQIIQTDSGVELSFAYLSYVRTHANDWHVPTEILYGERDTMTSYETISSFAKSHGAGLTVMPKGEHWFHTEEQMRFLDQWIVEKESKRP